VIPTEPAADFYSHLGYAAAKQIAAAAGNRRKRGGGRPRSSSWEELPRRVFSVDVLESDRCGGRMRILCAINPPDAIRKILNCLGLPSKLPPSAPAGQDSHEIPALDPEVFF